MKKRTNIGSNFDDFLTMEGELEETTAIAVARVIAWELRQSMKENEATKALGE